MGEEKIHSLYLQRKDTSSHGPSIYRKDQLGHRGLHINPNIWHFHHTGKLTLLYCPTEQMWADVLTRSLQGLKFCLMRSNLMNCPVDYCEEAPFIPSPNPTLAPARLLSMTSSPSLPSPNNSSAPMKPRVSLTMPSLLGCVGVIPTAEPTDAPSSHQSCEPVPKYSGPPDKKVSWRDTLFQSH